MFTKTLELSIPIVLSTQKYTERKAMAAKATYASEEEKEKWLSIIRMEMMSSEESADDEGEDVIVIHPLPWLSAEVTAFKQKLDEKSKNEKSPLARRQTKKRITGLPSMRSAPEKMPAWAVVTP